MPTNKSEELRRVVIGRLESLQQAGVLQLPKANRATTDAGAGAIALPQAQPDEAASSSLRTSESNRTKSSAWQRKAETTLFDPGDSIAKADVTALTLDMLQQHVAGCTRCDELARTRTQTVFGVGNKNARLCFLGEAPGADEDRSGIPFVGRGGQLLTKIIEACRMKRDDVYILNMIKCRPPGNRNPLPEELANCRGYLDHQFELIRPEFICCLGAVAAQNLLGTTVSIGKLRGRIHSYRGAKVVCTYHPAFLLRSPSFKKEAWEDMKLLMREMGVEL